MYTRMQVATFVDEAVKIAQNLRTAYGPKLKDFKDALATQVRTCFCCLCYWISAELTFMRASNHPWAVHKQ